MFANTTFEIRQNIHCINSFVTFFDPLRWLWSETGFRPVVASKMDWVCRRLKNDCCPGFASFSQDCCCRSIVATYKPISCGYCGSCKWHNCRKKKTFDTSHKHSYIHTYIDQWINSPGHSILSNDLRQVSKVCFHKLTLNSPQRTIATRLWRKNLWIRHKSFPTASKTEIVILDG